MRKPGDNANDFKQVKSYLNERCTMHIILFVYVRDLQDYTNRKKYIAYCSVYYVYEQIKETG